MKNRTIGGGGVRVGGRWEESEGKMAGVRDGEKKKKKWHTVLSVK